MTIRQIATHWLTAAHPRPAEIGVIERDGVISSGIRMIYGRTDTVTGSDVQSCHLGG